MNGGGSEILFVPGPVRVAPAVLAAAAAPVAYHRGPAYSAVLARVTAGLRTVFGSTGAEVYLVGSSGTGALESAFANLCRPGDEVVVAVNGHFGGRLAAQARGLGLAVREVELPWERPVGAADLAPAVGPRTVAVALVHLETSTGVVNDVASIGRLCAGDGPVLLVDAVGSAGALPIEMDAAGLDVVVTSSQKGLGAPPGLAGVAVSTKAWRRRAVLGQAMSWYFDWQAMRLALREDPPQSPWTPAVPLVYALNTALDLLLADGLAAAVAARARLGAALRVGLGAAGFSPFDDGAGPVSPVTVAYPPAGVRAADVIGWLRRQTGVVVAGGQGRLKGQVVRVSHLGDVGLFEVLGLVSSCAAAVADLAGRAPDGCAGAAAAAHAGRPVAVRA